MKFKKRFILIILIIILIFTTTGCIGFNGSVKNIVTKYTSYDIDFEKSIQLEKIKDIEISGNVSQINFNKSDNNEIKVHLYGKIEANYEPELIINSQSNYVEIRTENKDTRNMKVKDNKLILDVYLPDKYKGSIDASCISGDIFAKNYSLENVKMTSISGNIEVLIINCKDIKLETISGNINGMNLVAEKSINVESISGEIIIKNTTSESIKSSTTSSDNKLIGIKSKAVDIGTISGNAELAGYVGNINIETTSGDIRVENSELTGDIFIDTVSGKIDLNIPEESNFELKVETISGKLDTSNLNISNVKIKDKKISGKKGTGEYNVELKTVSGDVNIKEQY